MTSRKRETSPAGNQPAGLVREWTIPLPYVGPPITMNEISGKHWSRYLLDRRDLIKSGFYLARHHKIPLLSCVTVELIYWPGDNRPRSRPLWTACGVVAWCPMTAAGMSAQPPAR